MSDIRQRFCFEADFKSSKVRDAVLWEFEAYKLATSDADFESLAAVEAGSSQTKSTAICFIGRDTPDVQAFVQFLQKTLAAFRLDITLGFEWSCWSETFEEGSFGGGAVVVTRNGVVWNDTRIWLENSKKRKKVV